jgi:serine/threonine protein kinase
MNQLLGRGPVAEVYAVAGTAVKVFPGRFDRRTLAAIARERAKLARVTAPVLPVDAVEVVDGKHVLRMALCAESLAGRVEREGPLPAGEVAALCETLSRALAAAHRLGVLHGGVSPANVLYRPGGDAVLADFGLAQRLAFRRDPLHVMEWLSPEKLRTAADDVRTDWYGLGAVLHFALTGESPQPSRIGESTGERILRMLDEPVRAISRPDVPIGLATTIARLLAPDPARRSAPWAHEGPVTPSRTGRRGWRLVPAAAVVVLVAALAVVFWPRPEQTPPSPAAPPPPPVIELADPDDLGAEVSLSWTATDDRLFFAVVFWAEGEPRRTELARRDHAMTVPVEPDRGYCFLVRGTNADQIVESRVRAVRGAVCDR